MHLSLTEYEVWFITGSQHLYGEKTLKQVAQHAKSIASSLNDIRRYR
jgi:L-arabinose isomerase